MVKTKGITGRTLTSKNTKSADRDLENFVPTLKAKKILDRVKKNPLLVKGQFINKCIEEYGRLLLKTPHIVNEKRPTLVDRLTFLEEAALQLSYEAARSRLKENKSTAAHKNLLKEHKNEKWYALSKEFTDAAEAEKKTADTSLLHLQALVRCRDDFLNGSLKK